MSLFALKLSHGTSSFESFSLAFSRFFFCRTHATLGTSWCDAVLTSADAREDGVDDHGPEVVERERHGGDGRAEERAAAHHVEAVQLRVVAQPTRDGTQYARHQTCDGDDFSMRSQ